MIKTKNKIFLLTGLTIFIFFKSINVFANEQTDILKNIIQKTSNGVYENQTEYEKDIINDINLLDITSTGSKQLLNILNKKYQKRSIGIEFKHEGFNLVITNPLSYKKQYGENFDNLIRRNIIDEISKMNYSNWNDKVLYNIKTIKIDNTIEYGDDKLDEKDQILIYINENYKNELKNSTIYFTGSTEKQDLLEKLSNYKYNKITIDDVSGFFMSDKLNYINGNFDIKYLINHGMFEITTLRERQNVDQSYRLKNITTAFSFIGENKILLPQIQFSFNNSINYDPKQEKNYLYGASISGNEEVKSYGGGLCGAATAIYQGVFLNKGIEITSVRNHSWWYGTLYNMTLNGEKIKTPGLDATIWIPGTDLNFKNITNKPILFGTNIINKKEQVYTISEIGNKGSFSFTKQKGNCYTWNINGKNRTSCYTKVK